MSARLNLRKGDLNKSLEDLVNIDSCMTGISNIKCPKLLETSQVALLVKNLPVNARHLGMQS